jgi:hypothetical protein
MQWFICQTLQVSHLGECSVWLARLVLPPTCNMRVTAQNSGFEADSEFDVIAVVIAQTLQSYLTKAIVSDRRLSTMPSLASPTTPSSLTRQFLTCVDLSEPPAIHHTFHVLGI